MLSRDLSLLKQLARRVDDVKFVGIAVPGEDVEKQEVLAQIFVMPDVREERSRSSQQLSITAAKVLNEQGRNRYAFVHKTFQKYLTAEEIYYLANRELERCYRRFSG